MDLGRIDKFEFWALPSEWIAGTDMAAAEPDQNVVTVIKIGEPVEVKKPRVPDKTYYDAYYETLATRQRVEQAVLEHRKWVLLQKKPPTGTRKRWERRRWQIRQENLHNLRRFPFICAPNSEGKCILCGKRSWSMDNAIQFIDDAFGR